MYADTMKLKESNPQLKILLAVGGWTHGTSTFTAMVLFLDLRPNCVKLIFIPAYYIYALWIYV